MERSLAMIRESDLGGEDTLIVGLTFKCNSRCRFCFVEKEIEEGLPNADGEVLDRVFALNGESRRFRRLTLTGAEVTLLLELEDWARRATTEGGFEVVRIQTNGRLLRDRALVDRLMVAGVREYFVSIHAHEPALDAHLTRSPPSFRQMREGVAHLLDAGARVISNTVVTRENHAVLPEIAAMLVAMGVHEAQFWSFLEIGAVGQEESLVSPVDAVPFLLEALERLDDAAIPSTVKWFPRCRLGRFADRLDNHQPHMLIHDEFQSRIAEDFRFGCAHEGCAHLGAGCDGLPRRHRKRFGDLADWLRPEVR